MYRLIKLLTPISFLLIVIPGAKLSFPVWALITAPLLGLTGVEAILMAIGTWAAVIYLIVSAFKKLSSRRDRILQTICIGIFWVLMAYWANKFILYGDTRAWLQTVPFIILSIVCLYRCWLRPSTEPV